MGLLIRTAGLAVVASALLQGAAVAGDGLTPRPPDRQIIESQRRVSDGRKLQREADGNLRKAVADDRSGQVDPGAQRARDSSPIPGGDRAND